MVFYGDFGFMMVYMGCAMALQWLCHVLPSSAYSIYSSYRQDLRSLNHEGIIDVWLGRALSSKVTTKDRYFSTILNLTLINPRVDLG